MNRWRLFAFALAAIGVCVAAEAQVGKSITVVDASNATDAQLQAVPHLTPALRQTIIAKKPFANIGELNAVLVAASLTPMQITEVYGKIFVHVNLNTATREEILMIPGSGPRTVREFQEYRPYKSLAVFHREMRKYWTEEEVSRLEQYVFVPVNLNTATDEEVLTIPGSGPRFLREFKEYRPYKDVAQFHREMRKYWDEKEVSRLERYVTLQ